MARNDAEHQVLVQPRIITFRETLGEATTLILLTVVQPQETNSFMATLFPQIYLFQDALSGSLEKNEKY